MLSRSLLSSRMTRSQVQSIMRSVRVRSRVASFLVHRIQNLLFLPIRVGPFHAKMLLVDPRPQGFIQSLFSLLLSIHTQYYSNLSQTACLVISYSMHVSFGILETTQPRNYIWLVLEQSLSFYHDLEVVYNQPVSVMFSIESAPLSFDFMSVEPNNHGIQTYY